MKQLKTRSYELRSLFEDSITIEYIAEPLQSLPFGLTVQEALDWMDQSDFDVMGVVTAANGMLETVTGYLERGTLREKCSVYGDRSCGNYQRTFHPSELISISTPLIKLLPILQQHPRLFVLDGNQISGILTCGDLQKAPVRMLLFGLITLLEMNLLRLVRRYYSDDSWKQVLKSDRLQTAERLWQASQSRNEATDLTDYLQFCDKRELVLHHPELLQQLGISSKRAAERSLKHAEQLRNRLAHAQDLVNGSSWQELITLAADLETLLKRCEQIE